MNKTDDEIKEFLKRFDRRRNRVVNVLMKPEFYNRLIDYMKEKGLVIEGREEEAFKIYGGVPVYKNEYLDKDYRLLEYRLNINNDSDTIWGVSEVIDM